MNRIVHFEIHAENPERAANFYKKVFDWDIQEWKFPDMEIKDENRYWIVMTADKNSKEIGINGGLLFRKGPKPTQGQPVNAYVSTVGVDSVDKYLKKVIEAGGSIALPKMEIKDIGWQAYCLDTEGNLFGIHQPNEKWKKMAEKKAK